MVASPAHKLRLLLVGTLFVLLVLCLAWSWATRDVMSEVQAAVPNSLVDLRPWQTAQALAALTSSSEETEIAREAEHLADHDVDQAFAAALRQAAIQRPSLTTESITLSRRVSALQQNLADDQARVQALTKQDPDDDLEIAKAQLGLDSDQLSEAQQDLARARGDQRGRIQKELAAHEAAMRKYDTQTDAPSGRALAAAQKNLTVAGLVSEWFKERARRKLLAEATASTLAYAAEQTAKHKQTENGGIAPSLAATKSERLANLSVQSARSQLLAIYDDRIATERQLAQVYRKWAEQVSLQHRITAHRLTQSFALIAFTLLGMIALDVLAFRIVNRSKLDQRSTQTLSAVLKFVIQFTGLLFVLFIIFGTPNQMPTIVGLTTAGLTVALQDFIIAFFGWFVLMGRNGLRVGDWVEINGIAGEVVNLSLFRTSMLETGNTSEKGHPTGRRTTFINSFAIKGQFFNYSTAGQWMWDEIRVGIPPERDTYETIDLVRKEVVDETAKDTRMANDEWKQVNRHFTAEPAVDMRPGSSGIDLVVRYVTRASTRFEVRNRLYQKILRLLHQPADQHVSA